MSPVTRDRAGPAAAAEAALAFLGRAGCEPGVLRLSVALGRRSPDALRELAPDPDPGTPVREVVARLAVLDEHRRLADRRSRPLLRALADAQQEDGGFDPDAAPAARLALAGRAAGLLSRSPHASPRLLAGTERFLARHWSVERARADGAVALSAFLPFFSASQHEFADAGLHWCGRELERAFRAGEMGPVEVGWLFLLCDARALPGAGLASRELVDALLDAQTGEGSFPAGTLSRETATLRAALVLLHLSRTRGAQPRTEDPC